MKKLAETSFVFVLNLKKGGSADLHLECHTQTQNDFNFKIQADWLDQNVFLCFFVDLKNSVLKISRGRIKLRILVV